MYKMLIIGNAYSVFKKKLGKKIDAFDGEIIRCNDYKIIGFEQYVGTRIDIWVRGNTSLEGNFLCKNDLSCRMILFANNCKNTMLRQQGIIAPSTGLTAIGWTMEIGHIPYIHGFDFFQNTTQPHYFETMSLEEKKRWEKEVKYLHNGELEKTWVNSLIEEKKIIKFKESL